ncbi:transcriptional regulator TACO1-like protein [Globomyces pollinis-pini]|nr:transcriptional regulator TACO1-like protein [Globomyces pollinis-pini]
MLRCSWQYSLRIPSLKCQVRYAGHNRWSKVRHIKGAQDAERSKLFSRISRQIVAAINAMGGETDPQHNHYLAAALHIAKDYQVPKSTIQDALKRATSKQEKDKSVKMVRYEGLGPGGVAVVVECLVENPNKTAADIKLLFKKAECSLGNIMYLFEKRGRIILGPGNTGHDVGKMIDLAIEAEVDDIGDSNEEENWLEVFCSPTSVYQIQNSLSKRGYEIKEWSNGLVPIEKVQVDKDHSANLLAFLHSLESQDEVVNVYHNAQ